MKFMTLPLNRTALLFSFIFISPFSFCSEYSTSDPASTIIEDFSSSDAVQDTGRDFSGHRIGMGASNASYVDSTIFVFDYGYEFNRYIGFMLSGSSYDGYSDKEVDDDGNTETFRDDGVYTRVAADVGYTFDLTGFDIKPYVSVGILYLSESNGLENNSEVAFQYGGGIRTTLDMGVYLDAAYKTTQLDNWIGSTSEREGDEVTLTLGYKF